MTNHDPDVRRVLILDDDLDVLQTLERYLAAPHLHIVSCSEIEAAECLLDYHRFDVLVTDLEVSDLGGLEGIRLIRHAAVHFPHLEVIVFSGKLSRQVRDLGIALKVNHMLAKPSELRRLRDLIDAGCPQADRENGDPHKEGEVTRVGTLEEILAGRRISAVLQPILSLDPVTNSWTSFGAEGLARGPGGSLLENPELLLGYASKKERLFEAEIECIQAVLSEAQYLGWLSKLFINIRPRSLSNPRFASILHDLVGRHGFEPSNIVLELTEQQSILNLHAFDSTLARLRDMGFGLALDDFGRGFANLQLLQRLPLDYLKIDGFFCDGIEDDYDKQAIVRSALSLARDLGIRTIMERVETEAELKIVSGLGVSLAQGYFFSRPAGGAALASSFRQVFAFDGPEEPMPLGGNGKRPVVSPRERVGHEISNSLTAISLYTSQCLEKVDDDDPLRRDLEEILGASEQAVALSSAFLDR